jgi:hypothetical protein
LARIGVEYGFGAGRGWEVAPALNLDFASDQTTVNLGVSLARKF